MAFHPPKAPRRWSEGPCKGRRYQQPWARSRGPCSDTRTCGRTGRSSGRGGTAKSVARGYPPDPAPAAVPSNWNTQQAAVYPTGPGCAARAQGHTWVRYRDHRSHSDPPFSGRRSGPARRAAVGTELIERVAATGSLVIRKLGETRAGELAIHRFLSVTRPRD